MSYDNPVTRQYPFTVVDFGVASDVTETIAVPQKNGVGMSGRVVDVIISDVSEDFAGSNNDAGIEVGDGTDPNKYYDTGLVLDEAVDIADNATLSLADTRTGAAVVGIEPGRSTITVTIKVADGSETGKANVDIVVEWF